MAPTTRIAAARICAQGLPPAAAAAITAFLAPFGAAALAGLAALVGAGTWTSRMRRSSTLLPVPERFIGR